MINFWFVRKDKVIGEVYYGAIGSNFLMEEQKNNSLDRHTHLVI